MLPEVSIGEALWEQSEQDEGREESKDYSKSRAES